MEKEVKGRTTTSAEILFNQQQEQFHLFKEHTEHEMEQKDKELEGCLVVPSLYSGHYSKGPSGWTASYTYTEVTRLKLCYNTQLVTFVYL